MFPIVVYLLRDIRVTFEALKYIVVAKPQLFTYSISRNIEPKVAFLQNVVGLTDGELRSIVSRDPAVLGYSLQKRLRPRFQFLRKAYPFEKAALPPSEISTVEQNGENKKTENQPGEASEEQQLVHATLAALAAENKIPGKTKLALGIDLGTLTVKEIDADLRRRGLKGNTVRERARERE
jgi:hypothetical protein